MKRELERIEQEIFRVMTQLEDIKSSSAVFENSGEKNPYRKAELFDKLEVLRVEKVVLECRINKVESFLNEIDHKDAIILKHIYINNNKTIEDYAIQNGFAKNTLVRYTNNLLKDY